MKFLSPAFKHNEYLPSKYTCDGDNLNPPLSIDKVPENAQSLVLIVDDPDAPRGTWLHWTCWNIDPKTTQIPENSVPQGAVEGMTDSGTTGYSGPRPPSGTHRYFFKLYALDTKLDLPHGAPLNELLKVIDNHIIEKVEFIGLYSRS